MRVRTEFNMFDTISMASTLKDGYRKLFEKADLYSSLDGFTPETVENKLMDLYHRLREAQENETSVE